MFKMMEQRIVATQKKSKPSIEIKRFLVVVQIIKDEKNGMKVRMSKVFYIKEMTCNN